MGWLLSTFGDDAGDPSRSALLCRGTTGGKEERTGGQQTDGDEPTLHGGPRSEAGGTCRVTRDEGRTLRGGTPTSGRRMTPVRTRTSYLFIQRTIDLFVERTIVAVVAAFALHCPDKQGGGAQTVVRRPARGNRRRQHGARTFVGVDPDVLLRSEFRELRKIEDRTSFVTVTYECPAAASTWPALAGPIVSPLPEVRKIVLNRGRDRSGDPPPARALSPSTASDGALQKGSDAGSPSGRNPTAHRYALPDEM